MSIDETMRSNPHTQHAECLCACKCACVSTGGGTMYKNQILFYSLYNKAFAVLEMHLFHYRDKHHVKPTTVPCRNIIMTEVLAKCTETTTITPGLLMRSQSRTIGGICFVVIFQQEGCIIPTLRHHHNKETRIHGPLHETLNPPHPDSFSSSHAHHPLPIGMGNTAHSDVSDYDSAIS